MNKEEAKVKVTELVGKYQALSSKEVKRYNEANTRRTFIEPLFKALGWDIYDTKEFSEEEDASSGRVDYALKIKEVSRIYIEAKPLRADITRSDYVKQTVTYAYNKGVTWAVLTDFENLHLYVAQTGKLSLNLNYLEYGTSFNDLWLLSKESVKDNLISEWGHKYGHLPPKQTIEDKLFSQLRHWREELFKNLLYYNDSKFTIRNMKLIDEVIQRLLDRLIFIRTAEDRKIEDKKLLELLHQTQKRQIKGNLINKLREIFNYYDGYYDSDLFRYHLTDEVFIDNVIIEDVLNGLYKVPKSIAEYDFSVIEPDVLGTVYEQYLGFVAAAVKQKAKAAQAKLDLGFPADDISFELTAKKKKRKEHGIYYTPQFVTDYIVKETVGRFLKEHSYNETLNIKVLDPACGSGSFLIRAFDELLNYHAGAKGKPILKLDQWERLQILCKNIFGIDLDIQAVEISRLNLLLRSLAKRELLPSLEDNIKQGNSLISGTKDDLKGYFGTGWKDKKPFNWDEEFADIIAQGGFDVVIGNPPYVRVDSLSVNEKRYWKDIYESAKGKYDIYYLFIELALSLVKENGVFAFITPNRFLTNTTGQRLRELILEGHNTISLVSLSTMRVFEDAANYPVITIVRKNMEAVKLRYYEVHEPNDLFALRPKYQLKANEVKSLPRSILPINVDEVSLKLALKIAKTHPALGSILDIQEGLRIPQDQEVKRYGDSQMPIIKQFQFTRYSPVAENTYVSRNYLDRLKRGNSTRLANCLKPKIIFAEDALRIEASLDLSKGLCQGGVYFGTTVGREHNLYYLLTLLNSSLLTFIFKAFYSGIHMGGGYLRFRTQYLEELPIRQIDLSNSTEKQLHDNLVSLVKDMLGLNQKLTKVIEHSEEWSDLKNKIAKTDKKIDNLVYKIYGLTEDEIKIVEQGTIY